MIFAAVFPFAACQCTERTGHLQGRSDARPPDAGVIDSGPDAGEIVSCVHGSNVIGARFVPHIPAASLLDAVLADFNRDGKLDVAVANGQPDPELIVHLGSGAGHFADSSDRHSGEYSAIAAGDFDGDQLLDLAAITRHNEGRVDVWLGTGDGLFSRAAGSSEPVSFARDAIARDFDGDGDLDLAISARGSGSVNILFGRGDGQFETAVIYPVGDDPGGLEAEDLDGDGNLDLVIALGIDNQMVIFYGKDDHTFAPAVSVSVPQYPNDIAIADLDYDGNPDILVAASNSGNITVFFGGPDRQLSQEILSSVGGGAGSVAVADFTGDNIVDVAAGGIGHISFYRGTGTRQIGHEVSHELGRSIAGNDFLQATDFDGDGRADLMYSGPGSGGGLGIIFGHDFGFEFLPQHFIDHRISDIRAADVNGDRALDLLITHEDNGTIGVFLGGVPGIFSEMVTYAAGDRPQMIAPADLDGDGDLDLAVACHRTNGAISVLTNRGDGSFEAATRHEASSGPSVLVAGNFDSDGDPDLAVSGPDMDAIAVLSGGPGTTFSAPARQLIGERVSALAVGNFDKTGHDDLLVSLSMPDGLLLLETFSERTEILADANPRSIAVADFNRDGELDVAVPLATTSEDSMTVVLGAGGGNFRDRATYATAPDPRSITTGDFDGDGRLDVAIAHFRDSFTIFRGKGDGTFAEARTYSLGGDPQWVTAGDFDGDGKDDLAIAHAEELGRITLVFAACL